MAHFSSEILVLDSSEKYIRSLCARHAVGGVIFEAIQGDAGIRVPPVDFSETLEVPLLKRASLGRERRIDVKTL